MPQLTKPTVIVAADLAPADTATLDLDHVVGIVTELGGPTSHTAIIAAQLEPALRGPGRPERSDWPTAPPSRSTPRTGTVVLDPDDDLREAIIARAKARAALKTATGGPGKTKDGQAVQLLANIGAVEDAEKAAKEDVEGVGLFRTEVLFLDSKTAPTVETQVKAYTKVFKAFGDRKVVIRTLDAGADKPLAFAPSEEEENPALGVRGYRMDRRFPQLLDDQLTAIAQAAKATGAKVWVMAPMVVHRARGGGVRPSGCAPTGCRSAGMMVEVPAAALRAPAHDGDRRLRQHRHQRPDPVRDGHRPDGRRARRAARPVAARRARPDRRDRRGRQGRGQAGRRVRRGRPGSAAGAGAGRAGHHQPVDGAVRGARRSGSRCPARRSAQCEEMAAAARDAADAAAGRAAVEKLVDPEVLLAL